MTNTLTTIIATAALVIVIILAAFVVTFTIPEGFSLSDYKNYTFDYQNRTVYYTNITTITPTPTIAPTPTPEPEVDLRLVALPYLVVTDIENLCIVGGATWHEEQDWVGCDGLGPADCNSGAALAAQAQCLGVGGDWYCGLDGIYCRLP